MPYHSHRRTDCNTDRRDPGVASRAFRSPPREAAVIRWDFIGADVAIDLVRTARITDIERLVALSGDVVRSSGSAGALGSADLLRQLVYLPQASIFVAEARRDVVGGAVLALRPSVVAGGFAGTVDLLVVDPDHDVDRVTDALLEEVIRSAQNKGCSIVEATLPADPAERTRWERHGFVESGPRTELHVAAVGAGTSRSR
jgi:GNAT superfamily N-acetyltransferase